MGASLNISNILSQVKQLDREEQLTLLQKMAYLLKTGETKKASSTQLISLAGSGSDIWENANSIDKYIDEERR